MVMMGRLVGVCGWMLRCHRVKHKKKTNQTKHQTNLTGTHGDRSHHGRTMGNAHDVAADGRYSGICETTNCTDKGL